MALNLRRGGRAEKPQRAVERTALHVIPKTWSMFACLKLKAVQTKYVLRMKQVKSDRFSPYIPLCAVVDHVSLLRCYPLSVSIIDDPAWPRQVD